MKKPNAVSILLTLILFLGSSISIAANQGSWKNHCDTLAAKTPNIVAGYYTVYLNTDTATGEEEQVFWMAINSMNLHPVKIPKSFQSGGYVFDQGYKSFVLAEKNQAQLDFPNWYMAISSELAYLESLPSVELSCTHVMTKLD